MFGRPVPGERPDGPFVGFKLAHAVLSADGGRAGFAGLSMGANSAYGVTAEASCVWTQRHLPPKRRCGCGFYCLSALADAQALRCVTENRAAVLLEVMASGRFLRYERGLRYSRQRVRAVWAGRCGCGRPATALEDAGRGFVGWQCLRASCALCASRSAIALGEFAARLGGPVPIGAEPGTQPDVQSDAQPGAQAMSGGPDPAVATHLAGPPHPGSTAVLAAEIALVQARLDDLQARVSRHCGESDEAN
jgi:hypothetical protein